MGRRRATPLARPALRFFIQPLPGQPTECLVEGNEATLGRSANAHARVTKTEEGFRVEDLDSHNGTKVNGQSVEA
ncbi:MAG: FHA domain-containing protein [Acidobacteriota bacterium]|nr:FHA domain-containing protein [Acidobacteriota bacterium]